jgi:hypothetical protein
LKNITKCHENVTKSAVNVENDVITIVRKLTEPLRSGNVKKPTSYLCVFVDGFGIGITLRNRVCICDPRWGATETESEISAIHFAKARANGG